MRLSSLSLIVLAVLGLASLAAAQDEPRTPQGLYERGMNLITGTGPNRSDVEAVDYFRKSADAGYAPAQTVMGYLYETGTVVPADPQAAASWYEKSGTQGDRIAQWVLGRMYLTGNGVAVRDRSRAMNWLRPAAKAGDPFAALLLGEAEEEVAPQPAVPWYRKAAEQGLPEAQFRLGKLLASGRVGIPAKYDAYVWLMVAFENGVASAADDAKSLEAQLGSVKVEQGKIDARNLRNESRRSVVANGCTGWPGELDAQPSTPPIKTQPLCR